MVYLSGYDLAYPHAVAVAGAVSALPRGCTVLLDPGPLVAGLDHAVLDRVLLRTRWLSLNAREAALWTGRPDPGEAAESLLRSHGSLDGAVVRDGAYGAVVATRATGPVRVAGVRAERVVDTNGAGDVHAGAFLAGLAAGLDPVTAAGRANAAAALSVARTGPGLGTADG
jgi:sugar/nucleoside kinase (ribokinase family)